MSHPGILETKEALGEITHIVDAAQIVAVCRHFKEKEGYVRLSGITAVDWHPAEPRFEILYHLHSLQHNKRVRLKVRVGGATPEVESVCSVWRGADWYEREVYDMFGVGFLNHPDLQRILMPLDWEGYPLRKDYPVHGYKYSYPDEK